MTSKFQQSMKRLATSNALRMQHTASRQTVHLWRGSGLPTPSLQHANVRPVSTRRAPTPWLHLFGRGIEENQEVAQWMKNERNTLLIIGGFLSCLFLASINELGRKRQHPWEQSGKAQSHCDAMHSCKSQQPETFPQETWLHQLGQRG